jgi:hypothetical protein
MIRRRESEEVVEAGLMQGLANRVRPMRKVEVPLAALQRPGEPKDGADAPEADEIKPFKIDGDGLGTGVEALLYRRGKVVAVGRIHSRLGPSDQPLPLFQEPDLHALNCR